MSRHLLSNISSAYIEAANRLRPKNRKRKIVVYVESYDDIFFWRSVLSEFEDENTAFEVMLPSRTNLNRGKKTALMNKLGESLGGYMIACVDADLDYLLQRHTPSSQRMLDNPYVIHTYAYSIENYQCYAPSLHNVCVMATLNDRDIFNFEEYLRQYSGVAAPTWTLQRFSVEQLQQHRGSGATECVQAHRCTGTGAQAGEPQIGMAAAAREGCQGKAHPAEAGTGGFGLKKG